MMEKSKSRLVGAVAEHDEHAEINPVVIYLPYFIITILKKKIKIKKNLFLFFLYLIIKRSKSGGKCDCNK